MSKSHRTLLFAVIAAGAVAAGMLASAPESAPPSVIGRWNLTVSGLEFPACSWLEVHQSGDRTLVGQFVGWSGSARPISEIEFGDGIMRFTIPPQWESGDDDLVVEGTLEGDTMSGTIVDPGGNQLTWTGVRAPDLRRPTPPQWGEPITLLGGGDLSQWELPTTNNQWHVVDSVLANSDAGGNLVTREAFTDFKLHIEFKYPENGNSGVYLRGRHEVQIEDSPPSRVRTESLGAVYGFLAPNADAARGPDQWQTFDITLIGRQVTVALNGTIVINEREIPGITGGAMTCDEGAPGPLMLQGDHGPIAFRNMVLTPAR